MFYEFQNSLANSPLKTKMPHPSYTSGSSPTNPNCYRSIIFSFLLPQAPWKIIYLVLSLEMPVPLCCPVTKLSVRSFSQKSVHLQCPHLQWCWNSWWISFELNGKIKMAKKNPFTCYENWLNSKNTAKLITPGMENCVGELNNFLFSLASWFLNRQIAAD